MDNPKIAAACFDTCFDFVLERRDQGDAQTCPGWKVPREPPLLPEGQVLRVQIAEYRSQENKDPFIP
jgi:hypothetical protein